jgi:large subunit ribosomal protein L6
MVKGVSEGFYKDLIIQGVGYKAEVKGKNLVISIGYAHQIEYPIPGGIEIVVEKGTKVTVKGIDKELVGRVASQLRSFRVPDPYKEKGIKYLVNSSRERLGKQLQRFKPEGRALIL